MSRTVKTDSFHFLAPIETATDDFRIEEDEAALALLLPAVQSAREAPPRTTCGAMDDDAGADAFAAETEETGFTLVELLVVI